MVEKCMVYELLFPNNRRYIGVTNDVQRRLRGHKKANSLVGNAIRKHGKPVVQVLLVSDREYCYNMEQLVIAHRNTKHPAGYNLDAGGKGAPDPCDMTRNKMKKSRLGAKHTLKTREKLAIAARRENLSAETRTLRSLANRQRIVSQETKNKIRLAGLARWERERQKNG